MSSRKSKSSVEEIHKNNTGKVSDKWESYLSFYDQTFEKYRADHLNLFEIGIQNGGSLETWSKYFVNADHIVGCDVDERCQLLKYDDPRVSVIVGDANSRAVFDQIKTIADFYDIVIDDGSHRSADILNSFLIYFPLVRSNGLYIIEDTHSLYWNDWGGGILNELSAYSFFKRLVDFLNLEFWENDLSPDVYLRTFFAGGQVPNFIKEGWIESIEFRNSLIVIKKSASPSNSKLGKRLITGSEAAVTGDQIKNLSRKTD